MESMEMRTDPRDGQVKAAGTAGPAPARSRWRWLPWALAAAAVVGAVVLLGRGGAAYVAGFAGWVERQGHWGPVLFVLGYAAATVAFLPGSLLTLAAGALFGLVWGTAIAFGGAVAGSTAAFLVSRYLARPLVVRRLAPDPRFRRIDEAVGARGLRLVLLLRLSPVLPFNVLNYALGATRVRLGDYLLGAAGMLPGTVLYVWTGKLAGDVASVAAGAAAPRGPGYWTMLGVGLAATAAVTVMVTRMARRALRGVDEDHV
jgi:uncharacterized membrane protein YdjX (TVP38/TMEM64 family)